MKKLSIDFGDLMMPLGDHDRGFDSYLDTETGEIVSIAMYDHLEEDDESRERIENDESGRYIGLEPISSNEGFRFMEDFVDTLDDGPVRHTLLDALDRPRPFRRFKDALYEFPEVRDRWYAYETERQKEWARDYLNSYDIEPVWKEPVRQET